MTDSETHVTCMLVIPTFPNTSSFCIGNKHIAYAANIPKYTQVIAEESLSYDSINVGISGLRSLFLTMSIHQWPRRFARPYPDMFHLCAVSPFIDVEIQVSKELQYGTNRLYENTRPDLIRESDDTVKSGNMRGN
jgi:hypothetical protein